MKMSEVGKKRKNGFKWGIIGNKWGVVQSQFASGESIFFSTCLLTHKFCSLNISVSFYIASSACLREPVFALCVSVDCATSPLLASPAFTLVIAALPCVTSDRCGAVTKTS